MKYKTNKGELDRYEINTYFFYGMSILLVVAAARLLPTPGVFG